MTLRLSTYSIIVIAKYQISKESLSSLRITLPKAAFWLEFIGVGAIFDRGAMGFWGPTGAPKWPSGAPNHRALKNRYLA